LVTGKQIPLSVKDINKLWSHWQNVNSDCLWSTKLKGGAIPKLVEIWCSFFMSVHGPFTRYQAFLVEPLSVFTDVHILSLFSFSAQYPAGSNPTTGGFVHYSSSKWFCPWAARSDCLETRYSW
jgi:hypothetical protein